MKHIITLLLLTVFSFGDFNYHLKPHHITSDIKCFFGLQKEPSIINGANVINTCYIKTEEGYIVIDSGPTYKYAQQAYYAIQKENPSPIKYVINTSRGELNTLGNEFYQEQGATVIGAKVERKTKKPTEIALKKSISEEAFENTRLAHPDISLNADKKLTVGSTKIEIKRFDDKLVVYLPQSKTIFVGDFVSDRPSQTKKKHSSTKKWADVFTKIEKLSWKYIISSHSLKNKRYAIENTKNYLKLFQAQPRQVKRTIQHKQKNLKKPKPIYKSQKKKVFIVKNIVKKTIIKKEKRVKTKTKAKIKHIRSIQYTNLSIAKKMALKEHKFVMIKIEADNCNPCKRLNKLLKTNNRIKKMVNNYIKAVKINRDHDTLPTEYDIRFAPTVLLVRPDSNQVLVQLEGSEAFEDLEDALKVFVSDSQKLSLALR